MRKLIIIAALFGGTLFAQADHYIASANTTAMTLQQPATNARLVQFPDGGRAGASIYCVAASTATVSWNATGATTTKATSNKLPPTGTPSSATAFSASNASGGTTGVVQNVIAGTTLALDLGWFKMGGAGIGNNLTITTSNTCTITFMWSEQ